MENNMYRVQIFTVYTKGECFIHGTIWAFFYFFCDHMSCLCLIPLGHVEFLQSFHSFIYWWSLCRHCVMPHLCNSAMSFSTVVCNVLSKSFWCITPQNMEQKSVSIVCITFKKAIFRYIRKCAPCRSWNVEVHTVRQD